jgi:hypothetical protein
MEGGSDSEDEIGVDFDEVRSVLVFMSCPLILLSFFSILFLLWWGN